MKTYSYETTIADKIETEVGDFTFYLVNGKLDFEMPWGAVMETSYNYGLREDQLCFLELWQDGKTYGIYIQYLEEDLRAKVYIDIEEWGDVPKISESESKNIKDHISKREFIDDLIHEFE